jgi:outer membrane protein assembly factor BamB
VIFALDANSGSELWRLRVTKELGEGLTIGSRMNLEPSLNLLYFTAGSTGEKPKDVVVAVETRTGKVRWKKESGY